MITLPIMTTPFYLLEEKKLRQNLQLISDVMTNAQVEIILAFKAYALWQTFPIFKEYIHSTTASSLNEARLAVEKFGERAHTYSPAYEEKDFSEIIPLSSHITFNSLSQYKHFYPQVAFWNQKHKEKVSVGIRINPEYSEIETALYNPCARGGRFGVLLEDLPDVLPSGIEGFHVHIHCESDSYALARSLGVIERKFSHWLPSLKWINLGGGHLMTKKGYDVSHLIKTLTDFRHRYPNLRVILEPGSAFAWETGSLHATVVDIVINKGIKTAILNVSFTCHMPDCLEMPYLPEVRDATKLAFDITEEQMTAPYVYRLGGNSCLSGDFMGYWDFHHDLVVGENIIFEDMIHYTTVKTNMFNGVSHPAICLQRATGEIVTLKKFSFEDYLHRMC